MNMYTADRLAAAIPCFGLVCRLLMRHTRPERQTYYDGKVLVGYQTDESSLAVNSSLHSSPWPGPTANPDALSPPLSLSVIAYRVVFLTLAHVPAAAARLDAKKPPKLTSWTELGRAVGDGAG